MPQRPPRFWALSGRDRHPPDATDYGRTMHSIAPLILGSFCLNFEENAMFRSLLHQNLTLSLR
jgi:hypothetical protein